MTLADEILHEQYESDGDLVVFRCSECGYVSVSLGEVHGHIERHRGYTRFGIQLPFTAESPGDFGALMDRTDVLRVTDAEPVPLSEVDGL